MSYLIEVQLAKCLIQNQLELNKIKFAETDDNRYLSIMNEFNNTLNTIKKMDECIMKMSKELKELKK